MKISDKIGELQHENFQSTLEFNKEFALSLENGSVSEDMVNYHRKIKQSSQEIERLQFAQRDRIMSSESFGEMLKN